MTPNASANTARPLPTLMLELEARATSNGHVCGVDEAGRGPLAGPAKWASVTEPPSARDTSATDTSSTALGGRAIVPSKRAVPVTV